MTLPCVLRGLLFYRQESFAGRNPTVSRVAYRLTETNVIRRDEYSKFGDKLIIFAFMKNKPLIFITNDDGVGSRGLARIIEVAQGLGRVVVIAPERSHSGGSHSITMNNPLYLRTVRREKDLDVYACSGTPVDCVKLAFDHLLADRLPDLTVSGINHGSNSAISVLYSGTMGAAIEASFYGSPAVGFSLTDHSPDADFDNSAMVAEKVMRKLLEGKVELPLCLNVNIPDVEIVGSACAARTRAIGARVSYAAKTRAGGTTTGSRATSITPNPTPPTPTSGRWRTAMPL